MSPILSLLLLQKMGLASLSHPAPPARILAFHAQDLPAELEGVGAHPAQSSLCGLGFSRSPVALDLGFSTSTAGGREGRAFSEARKAWEAPHPEGCFRGGSYTRLGGKWGNLFPVGKHLSEVRVLSPSDDFPKETASPGGPRSSSPDSQHPDAG